MKLILEVIRIIFIFLLLGGIMGSIVKQIYSQFDINVDNTTGGWLVGISILMLLFVLYRNKLQFSGFYKTKNQVKLPKIMSYTCTIFAISMLFIAPFFA
ncbi:hypothetical protein [Viridibacillus arvi]|uniref:hypothetical protein n=1 Tax=Viridibacillus arvi TaxID=263475 RepID=UPI00187B5E1F|nr:hypothetical protein [Viridibacillus sp. JNUCC-6]QOV11875.1 hypothetical protein JNUCC6_03605 [Viridibacillus sp. JNUCC-6]